MKEVFALGLINGFVTEEYIEGLYNKEYLEEILVIKNEILEQM